MLFHHIDLTFFFFILAGPTSPALLFLQEIFSYRKFSHPIYEIL